MTDSTFALFVLFSSVVQASGATIDCNTGCPVKASTYNITCASTSSGSCEWYIDSTKVITCGNNGSCEKEPGVNEGYNGYEINNTYYVLQIHNLSASTIKCTLGGSQMSCQVITVQEFPSGKLSALCGKNEVGCSGLTSHGTPPVTLELKNGNTVLSSTQTERNVTSQRNTTASGTYTCGVTGAGAKCLSPGSVEITCEGHAPTSPPDHATTAQPGKESLIIGISAGVGGVVLLIILITAICCYRRRAKRGDDKEHISKLAAKDKKREVNSNVYASPNALPAREKAVMCDNVVYESSGDTRDSGEAVFQDNVLYGRK